MTIEELEDSLAGKAPPDGSTRLVQALWHDRRGDWTRAHEITQDIDGEDAAWVHAYLHRKEGDLSNAAYWYGQAGRPPATEALDEEWHTIARVLLTGSGEP